MEVLRSTGARVGEIVAINRDMIDWQTGDIVILGEKNDQYRPIYLDTDARHCLILGHKDPGVTGRYYAQSTPETLRFVRDRAAA